MRGMTAEAVTSSSPGYSQGSTRTPALPLRARCPRSQRVVEEADIHVAHLSLVNFRSYPALSLDLRPGTVVVYGGNGQGKSNLLESIYMLAIAKSPRASADRELVRRQASDPIVYSRVAAVIREGADDLKLQIDIGAAGAEVPGAEQGEGQPSLMKRFRVNGAPRRAADLVGYLNAVMFSAHDLEVVYGSPTVRRRYLDILISQIDRPYLGALQRYQRVLYQRNHLLKRLREASSGTGELEVWNDRLIDEAKYVMARRAETIAALSELARPIHLELAGSDEQLRLVYRPSVPVDSDSSEEEIASEVRGALEERRSREIAGGVTVSGPHRDDFEVLIDDLAAAAYASRGQSRTAVLSLRLAEARHLTDRRDREPVLLLDDVLSELDANRRRCVLRRAALYEQCFVTTSDPASIDDDLLVDAARIRVRSGEIEVFDG